MENERNSRKLESVYSKKVRAGKRRTYFFDVRRTKGEDYFLTLTESSRKMEGGYERHKIFLYKEDFNRFIQSLEETIDYIKTELMPQYDYDEFTRRQEEYEARMAAEEGEDSENRPPRPPREENDNRLQRPPRDSNDNRPPRDDNRPPRPPRENRDLSDFRLPREAREEREGRDFREPQEPREQRDIKPIQKKETFEDDDMSW